MKRRVELVWVKISYQIPHARHVWAGKGGRGRCVYQETPFWQHNMEKRGGRPLGHWEWVKGAIYFYFYLLTPGFFFLSLAHFGAKGEPFGERERWAREGSMGQSYDGTGLEERGEAFLTSFFFSIKCSLKTLSQPLNFGHWNEKKIIYIGICPVNQLLSLGWVEYHVAIPLPNSRSWNMII